MAISEAERIRRAEELYYKRRYNQNYRTVQEKKKKHTFIRWLIGKVIYILLIIACVYGYNNKEYLFSEKFKEDVNNFIKTPIDLSDVLNKISTKGDKYVDNYGEKVENKSLNGKIDEEESVEKIYSANSNLISEKLKNISKKISEQSIAKVSNKNINNFNVEEYIKSKCDFIKPILGKVTSRYGNRTSKYKNVSKNHTGIDIAASIGTDIVSSIDGKVIEVSNEGNYGKHIKIASNIDEEISILYAHCSEILVEKGDTVKQSQVVAKVGNTGNTTGAHLHFEIRYKNEYINPDKILEF